MLRDPQYLPRSCVVNQADTVRPSTTYDHDSMKEPLLCTYVVVHGRQPTSQQMFLRGGIQLVGKMAHTARLDLQAASAPRNGRPHAEPKLANMVLQKVEDFMRFPLCQPSPESMPLWRIANVCYRSVPMSVCPSK